MIVKLCDACNEPMAMGKGLEVEFVRMSERRHFCSWEHLLRSYPRGMDQLVMSSELGGPSGHSDFEVRIKTIRRLGPV
jgi:hypothetical protein